MLTNLYTCSVPSDLCVYLQGVNASFAKSVLNVKALVGTFNQKKALEGAFSVIEIELYC